MTNNNRGSAMFGALAVLTSTFPMMFAAAESAGDGLASSLTTFGPFAPFALMCLAIMKILWDKVNKLEGQLAAAQDLTINKIVPALTDANRLLGDTSTELSNATNLMHQLASREQIDENLWRRLLNSLEKAEERERQALERERVQRELSR